MTAAQDKQIWRRLSAKVSIRSPPPFPNGQGIDGDNDEGKH